MSLHRPTHAMARVALAAALVATLAVTSPAAAQRDTVESASVAEPTDATAPRSLAGPRDLRPVQVSGGQPMYVVRAERFHAFDESGFDRLGSDEVYGLWRSGSSLAGTRVFGDVDSGETRYFERGQDCIYPIDMSGYLNGRGGDTWDCVGEGAAGPIEFDISLWENDSVQLLPVCFDTGIRPEPDCEDDHLGSLAVRLSEAELATAMPEVGDTLHVYRELSDCQIGGPYCSSGVLDATYFIGFEVIRVADRVTSDLVRG